MANHTNRGSSRKWTISSVKQMKPLVEGGEAFATHPFSAAEKTYHRRLCVCEILIIHFFTIENRANRLLTIRNESLTLLFGRLLRKPQRGLFFD